MTAPPPSTQATQEYQPPADGRATRWEQHNADRRRELVEATLRAIRAHGPGVGMDEVAAAASTSKTVLYRHFGDRAGLHAAVVESVHAFIGSHLTVPLSAADRLDPGDLVRALTDAYLTVVERDPEIYQFVVTPPRDASPDPVTGITARIGAEVADAFRAWLRGHGLDPRPANTWGHGVVGFIWAIADTWVTTGKQRPRADVVEFTARLFDPAFAHQAAAFHDTAPNDTAPNDKE